MTDQLATFRNRVIHGDALDMMRRMPGGSVDLVVTSPPYNRLNTSGQGLRGKTGGWKSNPLTDGYEENPDNLDVGRYVEYHRQCVWEMARLLTPEGAILYNHSPRPQRGAWQDLARSILRKLPRGFELRQVVIWDKRGGFNANAGVFTPSYEEIFIIARHGEWKSSETMALPDVWPLGSDLIKRGVPSFPLELPRRAIRSTPWAKVVLDPFLGSGTTAVAAVLEGRSYVGIDNSATMVAAAQERIILEAAGVDAPLDASPAEVASVDAPFGAPFDAPTRELTGVDAPLDVPPVDAAGVDAPLDVPPVDAAGVDAPLDAPPADAASLSQNDRVTLEYIQAASERQGGVPPVIAQSDFPLPRRTTQRSLSRLRSAGEVHWGETMDGRRGPQRYYLRGQQTVGITRSSSINAAPQNGASTPTGASNGASTPRDPGIRGDGSHRENSLEVNEDVKPGLPDPGAREVDAPLDAPPGDVASNDAPLCPLHQDGTCVGPTRYWHLKSAGDARGDLIIYCWGDAGKCSWVHSRRYGVIREPELPRLPDKNLTALYYDVAAAAKAAAATSVSDPAVYSVTDIPSEPRAIPERRSFSWSDHYPDLVFDDLSDDRPEGTGMPRPDPVSAWQAALGRLQLEIPQEQFNTFLRPCAGLGWKGDCLWIGAATTFAVSWLELPLHLEMVREAVSKTVGAESSVHFEAMPQSRRERNHEPSA